MRLKLRKGSLLVGVLFIIILFLSLSLFFLVNSTRKLPVPYSSYEITKRSFTYSYNCKTKNPVWILQSLTCNYNQHCLDLKDIKSFPIIKDSRIPLQLSPSLEDYKNSQFIPGQLVLFNEIPEEIVITTCSPMKPKVYDFWKKTHRDILELLDKKSNRKFLIFSGPLFTSSDPNFLKYETIGKNQIAVPTHFYIIVFNSSKKDDYSAWIIPNEENSINRDLDFYQAEKSTIEKEGGFTFPSNLDFYFFISPPLRL